VQFYGGNHSESLDWSRTKTCLVTLRTPSLVNTYAHKLIAEELTFQLNHFHSLALLILAYKLQTLLFKTLFQFWIDLEDQKQENP